MWHDRIVSRKKSTPRSYLIKLKNRTSYSYSKENTLLRSALGHVTRRIYRRTPRFRSIILTYSSKPCLIESAVGSYRGNEKQCPSSDKEIVHFYRKITFDFCEIPLWFPKYVWAFDWLCVHTVQFLNFTSADLKNQLPHPRPMAESWHVSMIQSMVWTSMTNITLYSHSGSFNAILSTYRILQV